MSDKPFTSASLHAKAKSAFASAKNAVAVRSVDPSLGPINQTGSRCARLPLKSLTRINDLLPALQPTAQNFGQKLVSDYPNNSVDRRSLGFIHLLRGQRFDAGHEPGWRWQHPGDRMLVPPVTPIWDGSIQLQNRLWSRCQQGYRDFLQFSRRRTNSFAEVASEVMIKFPICRDWFKPHWAPCIFCRKDPILSPMLGSV